MTNQKPTPIGIYVDVGGRVIEVFENSPNIRIEQALGFVEVNILGEDHGGEREILESYVLHRVAKSLSELGV